MPNKPVETRVVSTLDEVLYGNVPNTAIYSDPQEFEEAEQIFKNAEIGKEFSGMVHWQEWLKPLLEDFYNMARQSETDYLGLDAAKSAKLRNERVKAKFMLDYIKGLVEDAQTLPRPVFQKQ